jgi:hypothetical protein
MHATYIRPRYLLMILIAAPFLAFGTCIAWHVVSNVIRQVVSEVVRAVF